MQPVMIINHGSLIKKSCWRLSSATFEATAMTINFGGTNERFFYIVWSLLCKIIILTPPWYFQDTPKLET